jgi:DNA-binding transcriptional regulator LsrR (DeoR family)
MQTATAEEVADFFDLSAGHIRKYLREGKRYDYVYIVLSNTTITDKEKKEYLFNKTSLTQHLKVNIWNRYTGNKDKRKKRNKLC